MAQSGGTGVAHPDVSNVTYQFKGEDHTLGNTVRYMLMKNPDVEFAGYTIPHPSEPFMNVRVQALDATPAKQCMVEALNNITEVCDHVAKTYKRSVKKFKQEQGEGMDCS
uniref:DNA-directed RNA polymerases I and III subunit RPAC2 n=1 Tax=Noctiluca scintillans TaxID=2966 RepID=A0A7S1AS06_NOCSC